MLDIRWMREHRDELAAAMRSLNAEDAPWESALQLDQQRRQLLSQVEALRAELNSGSKEIGRLFRERQAAAAEALKERMAAIGKTIEQLDTDLRSVEEAFQDAMLRIPNLPEPDVPVAPDESGNVVVKQWGQLPTFDFTPLR
jgi:seryl-tRNA synthetase